MSLSRVLILLAAYGLGSIPFGWILFHRARGADIQDLGSRSTGASNVFREGGARLAAATLLLDASKGAAAVILARLVRPEDFVIAEWAAVFAIVGHVAPVWLAFRGGKGAATAAGAFAVLHPAAVIVAVALFGVVAYGTRHASLGSVLAAPVYAIGVTVSGAEAASIVAAWVAVALILLRHRENLSRLLRGEEPPLSPRNPPE